MGKPWTDEAFGELDTDNSGLVDREEFGVWWQKQSPDTFKLLDGYESASDEKGQTRAKLQKLGASAALLTMQMAAIGSGIYSAASCLLEAALTCAKL